MSTQVSQETVQQTERATAQPHVHVAIVGAGFSGLGLAIRLKQRGMNDFVILERARDVGGTWRDNTYPGCACDVPSHLYSFSFVPNPNWSHTYSRQPEILAYLRDCCERFGITPSIRWDEEVREARWVEDDQRWHITTTSGEMTADLLMLGNGPLSEPSTPSIPGLERFEGAVFHSSHWNHEHDLTGERVAVIGTGASAIQIVPQIQPKVKQLALFQRTPPWIMPRLDGPISRRKQRLFRLLPFTQRFIRGKMYAQRELIALAFVHRSKLLRDAERLAMKHMHAQIADPDLRAKLTPNYSLGCKRVLISDDFYPALAQENVELVTERISEIRAHSVVTSDGVEREVETIILATGFHVTDMPLARFICGRGGQKLADAWRDGPQAYLGTSVAGFPNLFLLIGPNTGLGHTSMIYMIESQITYLLDCLRFMHKRHVQVVEVRPEQQKVYNDEIQRRMQGTVWTSGCASWYLDAHGRNTTLWPGFTWEFRRRTRRFDAAAYKCL
jgi:cation diffusion facilitator CzcD-associated flavoprotein CzcO